MIVYNLKVLKLKIVKNRIYAEGFVDPGRVVENLL
jgi:hypothetical protein